MQSRLIALKVDGVVQLVGRNAGYFVIAEDYLSLHLPEEFKDSEIAQVRKTPSENQLK